MANICEVQNKLIRATAGLCETNTSLQKDRTEEINDFLQDRFFNTRRQGWLACGTGLGQLLCHGIAGFAGETRYGKLAQAAATVLPQVNQLGQSNVQGDDIKPQFEIQKELQKMTETSDKTRTLTGTRDSVEQKLTQAEETKNRGWNNAKAGG